jgi:hypothetical protein
MAWLEMPGEWDRMAQAADSSPISPIHPTF